MTLSGIWSVLLLTVLVAGCASSGPSTQPPSSASPASSASPSTAASVASDLPKPVDIASAGALVIPAQPSIDWLVVVDGRPWITGLGDGIGILDASGKMQSSVAITGSCEAMDVAYGAVWSASCEPAGIIRIDGKTRAVRRAPIDQPIVDSEASVGAGEGAIWLVAGRSGALLAIDPQTLKVAHRYSIPTGGAGVRAGLGGVWVTRPETNDLLHVNPSSGAVVATIKVGPEPRFLTVGEGAVWVMNQIDGTVSRVDPSIDTVSATIDVGAPIHGGDIAIGGGSVWVRGGPELLARIDPTRNLVTERYGPAAGSGSVAADTAAVWVTAHDIATIWRLPLH